MAIATTTMTRGFLQMTRRERLSHLKSLSDNAAKRVQSSKNDWRTFLRFYAKMYKYPFAEALLLYEQAPQFTACGEIRHWNMVGRRVLRGTTGTPIVNDADKNMEIRFVYDVGDTYGEDRGIPRQWSLPDRYEGAVAHTLQNRFQVAQPTDNHRKNLKWAVEKYTRESCLDYLEDMRNNAIGSYLEELDDAGLSREFTETVIDSVGYLVSERLGLDQGLYNDDSVAFEHLYAFNTKASLFQAGAAVGQISRSVLTLIAQTIQNEQNKERVKSDDARRTIHDCGIQSGADDDRGGNRSDGGRSGNRRSPTADGQIRQPVLGLLEREPSGQVQLPSGGNDLTGRLPGSGSGSAGDDGDGAEPAPRHDLEAAGGFHGSGRVQHDDQGSGGGGRPGRDRIQTEIIADAFVKQQEPASEGEESGADPLLPSEGGRQSELGKNQADMAAGETPPFSDLEPDPAGKEIPDTFAPILTEAELPEISAKEHSEAYIELPPQTEETPSGSYAELDGAFFMPDNRDMYIREAILFGSPYRGGKERIYSFFHDRPPTGKEAADFLKKEYGIGGRTAIFSNGAHGLVDHDSSGFHITFRSGDPEIKISWATAAQLIRELVASGKFYMPEQALADGEPIADTNTSVEPGETITPQTLAAPSAWQTQPQADISGQQSLFGLFNVNANASEETDTAADSPNASSNRINESSDADADDGTNADAAQPDGPTNGADAEAQPDFLLELNDDDGKGETQDAEPEAIPSPPPLTLAKPPNFRITQDLDIGGGGAKTKYRRNAEAIRLLKSIEADGRYASPEEQAALALYSGWGGISQVFKEGHPDWLPEHAELKGLLSEREYRAASGSTLNAHYTTPEVIEGIYAGLARLGFNGGIILEPAMGVGNFYGCMPEEMTVASRLYGVELDSITGRIARQLYPNADVRIQGFETTDFQDNIFDAAIGNIPFGSYKLNDPKYDRYGFLIHDYFFAKALDKVRPGGVVAFVTSKGTMDKANTSVRRFLAERAELLGAIRLPNTAFKASAGTEVTSDILFLKKRDRLVDAENEGWIHTGKTDEGIPLNEYFLENLHLMLGTMAFDDRMYGGNSDTTLNPDGQDLREALMNAIGFLPEGVISEAAFFSMDSEADLDSIPADPGVKNFCYTIMEDGIYHRVDSRMEKREFAKTAAERVSAMIEMRTLTRLILTRQLEGCTDEDLFALQSGLTRLYDTFFKKFGAINTRYNTSLFGDDADFPLLSSIEELDEDGNTKKADVFTKRTIAPEKKTTRVDTPVEALPVCLNEKGYVDIGFMASLTGQSLEDVI